VRMISPSLATPLTSSVNFEKSEIYRAPGTASAIAPDEMLMSLLSRAAYISARKTISGLFNSLAKSSKRAFVLE
jgi:hypothetical protein